MKDLKQWQFTSESGRRARLAQPVAPRTLHGLAEVVRGGKRRCRPEGCVKAKVCAVARLPEEKRPEHCQALERHLRTYELALRRAVPAAKGVNAALIGVLLRREALLALADWFISEVHPFSEKDGQVVGQPVLNLVSSLLNSQARDLQALGARKSFAPPDPSQAFAQALAELPDATPSPHAAPGSTDPEEDTP